jgi:hypothetical protein
MGVKSFMIQAQVTICRDSPPPVYEGELRRGMLQIRLSAETKSQKLTHSLRISKHRNTKSRFMHIQVSLTLLIKLKETYPYFLMFSVYILYMYSNLVVS